MSVSVFSGLHFLYFCILNVCEINDLYSLQNTDSLRPNPNFTPTPRWNKLEPDTFKKLLQGRKQPTEGETTELQLIPHTSGFWKRAVLKRFREEGEKEREKNNRAGKVKRQGDRHDEHERGRKLGVKEVIERKKRETVV